jgi:hypothetical protein
MNPPNEREGRRLATDARGNHYNRGNRSIRRDCQECHDYEADPGDVLCYECKTRPAKLVVIPDVVERLALTAEPPSPASSGTIRAADVHAIQIDWLWEDRIPRGMVTVFTEPPKVGKSTILFDIAARASREGQHVRSRTCEHSRHCRASRSKANRFTRARSVREAVVGTAESEVVSGCCCFQIDAQRPDAARDPSPRRRGHVEDRPVLQPRDQGCRSPAHAVVGLVVRG